MALERPMSVRDYLEARQAAVAGSRLAGVARKGLASFKEILKNETPGETKKSTAGMKISEYLKNPVASTQAARPPRTSNPSNNATAGPKLLDIQGVSGPVRQTPLKQSTGSADMSGAQRASRFSQSTLQKYRAENGSGSSVESGIQQAAAKYNLSPDLIRSVIRAESNFQPHAVSSAGAQGLMQLMPETAKELGVTNPFDVQQNIDGGSRYLRQMLDRFGGDLKLALSAYNAGPKTVDQYNGDVPFSETRHYVKRVLRFAGLRA